MCTNSTKSLSVPILGDNLLNDSTISSSVFVSTIKYISFKSPNNLSKNMQRRQAGDSGAKSRRIKLLCNIWMLLYNYSASGTTNLYSVLTGSESVMTLGHCHEKCP